MDLFFMTVLMCVAGAFNDRGRWSVFRDVLWYCLRGWKGWVG